MSFPRYPKYKPSGVDWLGDVPEHWCVNRLKKTTYLKARVGWKGLTSEEFQEKAFAYLVTGTDFRSKYVDWDKCYQVDEGRYQDDPFIQLRNGDLLITKDGTIGKLAIVSNLDRPACLNSGIFVVRPLREYSTIFMYWILSSQVFSVFCDLESFGSTINHLYQNVFEQFVFPVPPTDEQSAIAGFLDQETSKIDSLVGEQRRLIELLKEKRQAVISHAVTKGLNPNAPLKPSGIQWLGDVPEHWDLRRVKTLSSFVTSGPRGWSERVGEVGSLFVQSGDLNDRLEVEFSAAKRVQIDDNAESARTRLCNGDVVVCVTGAKTGNVAVCRSIPDAAYVNQHLCLIRPTADVLPSFLGVVLKSRVGQTHFEVSQYGLKQGLSLEDVKEAPVILPSVMEQEEIIAFLDSETTKLDALTAEAERAIELLQERRTALISAAVTGKIDVRPLVHLRAHS